MNFQETTLSEEQQLLDGNRRGNVCIRMSGRDISRYLAAMDGLCNSTLGVLRKLYGNASASRQSLKQRIDALIALARKAKAFSHLANKQSLIVTALWASPATAPLLATAP